MKDKITTTLYKRVTLWVKKETEYQTGVDIYSRDVDMEEEIEHYLGKIETDSEHSLKLAWSIKDIDFEDFQDQAGERFSDNKMTRSEQAEKLWREFEDIPMNPQTETLEADWHTCGFGCFEKGTHREDIWNWFEDTFGVSVAARMEEGHF